MAHIGHRLRVYLSPLAYVFHKTCYFEFKELQISFLRVNSACTPSLLYTLCPRDISQALRQNKPFQLGTVPCQHHNMGLCLRAIFMTSHFIIKFLLLHILSFFQPSESVSVIYKVVYRHTLDMFC